MLRRIVAALLVTVITLASMGPLSMSAQDATPSTGTDGAAAGTPCPPLSPEDLEARANTFVDALHNEDLQAIEGLLHRDHTHHWAIGTGEHDAEAYLASLSELFDAFDDRSFTADDIIVADGSVVIRWTATGTQVEEFGGFPPTDEPATWTGITILEFQCGQIVEAWFEADHLFRLSQQGHVPYPDAAIPAIDAGTPGASGTPARSDCRDLTAAELEEQVGAFVEAMNAEDLSQLRQLLSGELVHHWPIGAGALDRDAFLTTFGALFDSDDTHTFTADETIVAEDDNVVVLRWTTSGTQVHDRAGFPPSDQTATWTGIVIFEFHCGQIVEFWAEADHVSRLRQHGHIPGPDEATPAP